MLGSNLGPETGNSEEDKLRYPPYNSALPVTPINKKNSKIIHKKNKEYPRIQDSKLYTEEKTQYTQKM